MPFPRPARTVAVLALALLAAGCTPENAAPTTSSAVPTRPKRSQAVSDVESLPGQPVPGFQMTDLNGNHLTPESLKGKVVLIDFWATWCGPCRAASPILQQLHEKYGGRGLVVIGANLGERDGNKPVRTKEPAEKYSREHHLTYTFTFANEEFAGACGVRGLPTMLILDRAGVVRKVQVGGDPHLFKLLETAILPLLDAAG